MPISKSRYDEDPAAQHRSKWRRSAEYDDDDAPSGIYYHGEVLRLG